MNRRRTVLWLLWAPIAVTFANGDAMPPTIDQVKAAHEKRLLALPGVVSVGIGRDDQGRSVIVVGLDQPRPQTESAVPRELDGFPVQVQTIGNLRAR